MTGCTATHRAWSPRGSSGCLSGIEGFGTRKVASYNTIVVDGVRAVGRFETVGEERQQREMWFCDRQQTFPTPPLLHSILEVSEEELEDDGSDMRSHDGRAVKNPPPIQQEGHSRRRRRATLTTHLPVQLTPMAAKADTRLQKEKRT